MKNEIKEEVGFYKITINRKKAQREADRCIGGKGDVLEMWEDASKTVREELNKFIKQT